MAVALFPHDVAQGQIFCLKQLNAVAIHAGNPASPISHITLQDFEFQAAYQSVLKLVQNYLTETPFEPGKNTICNQFINTYHDLVCAQMEDNAVEVQEELQWCLEETRGVMQEVVKAEYHGAVSHYVSVLLQQALNGTHPLSPLHN
jgi:hypothetical protein